MLATAVMPSSAWADNTSPVGLWKNIDDATGKPRALIRVTETAGTLQGTVVKVFPGPTEDQNPKCTKCEGARKNAPIVGIVMITGMRKDGDEYSGGEILDPENGKVYSSNMHLLDGGKKLSVRGYIGVSLLGRSQTWIRQE
ncbi:DUF2147 domain-containing protein [Rhizobium sp. 007]|uniref:DUF2147 domain-containing protein n=1 Tax=Rhizobium sp. 007 TaxID=2785056 RepID=UPI0032B1DE95